LRCIGTFGRESLVWRAFPFRKGFESIDTCIKAYDLI
jgi:hypothetical protein